MRSTPIHIPTILESGNDNYRLHTSQTLKHTSTAGDQSLGTDSIELSTQSIRIKDFLFLSLGFSPKSTPKDLYYICLTAFTLALPIESVLFCCVWVFESFSLSLSLCVCVGHWMSLISALTDDVTLGDLVMQAHAVLQCKHFMISLKKTDSGVTSWYSIRHKQHLMWKYEQLCYYVALCFWPV